MSIDLWVCMLVRVHLHLSAYTEVCVLQEVYVYLRPTVCLHACVRVCVSYATEQQLSLTQPEPSGFLIVLHSKKLIATESPLLCIKTIKTTLHAYRIITEGGVTYYIAGQVWMNGVWSKRRTTRTN